MYDRKINKEQFDKTTFLLGPRQVGKSTFLRKTFEKSLYIDLLNNDLFYEYVNNPGTFYENIGFQIRNNPDLKKFPIIIDEIQRIPILLNDVHRLIEEEGLKFILCGSSARKLVRGGANLLGGRAQRIEMRGLSLAEVGTDKILDLANKGSIPSHFTLEDPDHSIRAYIQNYLSEEIKGEALIRTLRTFNRFLNLVAVSNTEILNYNKIASDIGIDSKTVKEYYQILIDTLIGSYVEAFSEKKTRHNIIKSPKFYIFDTGISNYLNGVKFHNMKGNEFGKVFENIIYNEMLNYISYNLKDLNISYWRTYQGNEVDFIIGKGDVAIEVKCSENVKSADLTSLKLFAETYKPRKKIVVSNELLPRVKDDIEIIPYRQFVDMLWSGNLF